jgi:hypothetical protein
MGVRIIINYLVIGKIMFSPPPPGESLPRTCCGVAANRISLHPPKLRFVGLSLWRGETIHASLRKICIAILTFLICFSTFACSAASNQIAACRGGGQTRSDSMPEQIATQSARFLGKPYLLHPLDEKTLYRFDAFDCETYVDTVLALVFSNNNDEFKKNMNEIRYADGKPTFYTRNHFPSADWIPHNVKKGFVYWSPLNDHTISLFIQKRAWFAAQTKKPVPASIKDVRVTLPYIPLEEVSQRATKIPQGAIIFIVKPTFLLISHMGFALWKNNTLYFREASTLAGKVTDVELLPYLQAQSQFRYPIRGISVLVPNEKRQKS